jgi:glycosyltransferase involved in cell wall biosynthesis
VEKVSVCIPTYNGEKYLARCLDSILSQEFGDLEILIVDDRSTDGTREIIESYAVRDKRIRFERNPVNLGMGGNWNRCLELARGEWIKFVFQDDFIEPSCIKILHSASHKNIPIIFCRRNFIFETGVPERVKKDYLNHLIEVNQIFSGLTYISAQKYSEVVLDFIDKPGFNLIGEPTAVMFHRDVISKFGKFNPYMIQTIDEEFWTRIAVNTGLIYVEEDLATFRLHDSSTSMKNRQEQHYKVGLIDPLLRAHDMVFAPVYEPLRQIAKKRSPSINLMQLLRIRAYKARLKAIIHPNRNLMKEWKKIIHVYPKLIELSNFISLI